MESGWTAQSAEFLEVAAKIPTHADNGWPPPEFNCTSKHCLPWSVWVRTNGCISPIDFVVAIWTFVTVALALDAVEMSTYGTIFSNGENPPFSAIASSSLTFVWSWVFDSLIALISASIRWNFIAMRCDSPSSTSLSLSSIFLCTWVFLVDLRK